MLGISFERNLFLVSYIASVILIDTLTQSKKMLCVTMLCVTLNLESFKSQP